MKICLQRKLSRRMQRIEPANWIGQSPMIAPTAIHSELAARVQATS